MNRPLRIVHCFRSPVGGIFRHVRDLCLAQAEAGHAVGIICDSSTGGALEETYFRQIDHALTLGVERLPIQRNIGPGDLPTLWRSYRAVKKLTPDVLHGHGAKGGALARSFGTMLRVSKNKVARLYSPHGGVLHYDPKSNTGRVLFRVERMLEKMTDHILFVSDHERRAYLAKIGVPHAESSLVYNGIQDEEFEPVAVKPDAADLLYVGMMRDLKGPDLFIEAMAGLEKRLGRKLTATMVGDGPDLPRYKSLAVEHSLGERIRFLAPMPAREAFALGRIMVVPSRAEAMPYIVLEALAAGKTLVATRVGGIPEVFGLHSPALCEANQAELEERMAQALDDEEGFSRLMPDHDELHQRFGAAIMAKGVEAAYHAAIGIKTVSAQSSTVP